MGPHRDDSPQDDKTIGLPKAVLRGRQPKKPGPEEKPRGAEGLGRGLAGPPAERKPEESLGTLMPPRAAAPRGFPASPPETPPPQLIRGRDPDEGRDPWSAPPRPAAQGFAPGGVAPAPSDGFDPGWGGAAEAAPAPMIDEIPPPAHLPRGFRDQPRAPRAGPLAEAPFLDEPPLRSPAPEPVPPPMPFAPQAPRGGPVHPAPAGGGLPTMVRGGGVAVPRPAATRLLVLQYLQSVDASNREHWGDIEQVRPAGHVVGRGTLAGVVPNSESLATEHFVISGESGELFIEGFGTINGIYRKVAPGQRLELAPGARFQVGGHVIEFRAAEPARPVDRRISPDGEVFWSRPLAALGYLDFIGPDDAPALSFPLTKLDYTVIGREGEACDIGLAGDTWSSRRHARVVRQGDRFYLEDLGSTNGTFLEIKGRSPLRAGAAPNPGSADVLLIGEVLLRVVEK